MRIHLLSSQLANQIAAGEVIERPAAVIKEILENSIDAGADMISIDVMQGGIQSIVVRDNGCGIFKDDLPFALKRHATSKIKTLHDLENVQSLGFRGEALASISAIARVTLTSKVEHEPSAWQIQTSDDGTLGDVQQAAHPSGTTIRIDDLFYNTPARRKFLKSVKTEFVHIDECIRRIALCHPEIYFVLHHQDKLLRRYKPARHEKAQRQRLSKICSELFVQHSIQIQSQHAELDLSGWFVGPGIEDKQLTTQYMYVNGRMVRDRFLNHALRQAFELANVHWHPAYVLFLTLSPSAVDVNVHPSKNEVRFHQPRRIHDFIVYVLSNALQNIDSIENRVCEHNTPYTPSIDKKQQPTTTLYQSKHQYHREPRPTHSPSNHSGQAWLDLMSSQENNNKEKEDDAKEHSSILLSLLTHKYAFCQNNLGFCLVDLSLLDTLRQISRCQRSDTHALLLPVRFHLAQPLIDSLMQHESFLMNLGFQYKQLERKKGSDLVITHAPRILQKSDLSRVIPAWLAQKEPTLFTLAQEASTSHAAQTYNLDQAKTLLDVCSDEQINQASKHCSMAQLLQVFHD